MLASSVARHPSCLTSLAFSSTPLAAAVSIDAITTFLQRSNIEELRLEKCELDANTCCEIVTSLDGNTALRELRIVGNNNNRRSMLDSMSVTVIGRSCLRDLRLVDVTLTASVVRALADGLRGNITLESLSLASTGHPCAPEPFEDLLRHYNVNLQSVGKCRVRWFHTRSLEVFAVGQRTGPSGALSLAAAPVSHDGSVLPVVVCLGASVQQAESVLPLFATQLGHVVLWTPIPATKSPTTPSRSNAKPARE